MLDISSWRIAYYKFRLIDSRNRDLWDKVNKTHKITLKHAYEPNYAVYTVKNTAVIYIPKGNLDAAGFTHELLHLGLRDKGLLTGMTLRMCLEKKPKLSTLLSKELVEFVGNSLDHLKMLPTFLTMGYGREEFIMDYHVDKGSDENIVPIVQLFKSGNKYSKDVFDAYIGRYFSIVACPNRNYEYGEALNSLQKLAPNLFDILDRFTEKWIDLDINNPDLSEALYRPILLNFIDELDAWTNKKTFI